MRPRTHHEALAGRGRRRLSHADVVVQRALRNVVPSTRMERLDIHLRVVIRDLPGAPVVVVPFVIHPIAKVGGEFRSRGYFQDAVGFYRQLSHPRLRILSANARRRSVSMARPLVQELANHCISAPL